MKSFVRLFLIAAIFCLLFFILVFVPGDCSIKRLLDKESIEVAQEKDTVIGLFNKSFDSIAADLKEKGIDGVKNLKNNKMYKVYRLKDDDIVNLYKKEGSFSNLISDNIIWEIPIYNADGKIVSTCSIKRRPMLDELKASGKKLRPEVEQGAKDVEGQWAVTLIGNYIPLEYAALLSEPDKIAEFLNKHDIENPQTIKIVILPYATYMLYVKDNDKEFGIPFNYREDLIGIKNAEIYEMDAFIEIFGNFLGNKGGMGYINFK